MEVASAGQAVMARQDQQIVVLKGSDVSNELGTQLQLKQFYEEPESSGASPVDFEIANVAREQVEKIIKKFNSESKPSTRQQLGFSHKSTKDKVMEVLQESTNGDFNDLRTLVEDLEIGWKETHGPVYAAFKKVCSTLDDHKTILQVFPSQNNYASPLVGSITILMKAAKTHSDISLMLSRSVAEILDKVATCSNVITIIKTSRARRKLAEIYAIMFQFYQNAIEWYLQSKFGRFVRSFNENLVKGFEETKKQLEDSINELYREAAIANTAIVTMINGKVHSLEAEVRRQRQNFELQDAVAGQRMQKMMQVTWTGVKQLERMIQSATDNNARDGGRQVVQEAFTTGATAPEQASTFEPNLRALVIGEEGPALFEKNSLWLAEIDTLSRLQAWMASDSTISRTLWISSPFEIGDPVTEARAAALATVAAAWQAESPVLSYFCKRPKPNQLRVGMSIEQLGLLSMVYSFIHQLLQFKVVKPEAETMQKDFASLDGSLNSWSTSLRVLAALLEHTPVVTFCVVDGLNGFEWGNGLPWCKQFQGILNKRQQKVDSTFNVLLTTAGQSHMLPQYVGLRDRQIATKRAKEVVKFGKRIKVDLDK